MKQIISIAVICLMGIYISFHHSYDPTPIWFNHSGLIVPPQKRIYADTVTVTSASQTIDISAAGFSTVLSIQVQPQLNTTSASGMPMASIKSYSTTSVVVNFTQSNTTTVSILGAVVVGIQPLQSFTGVVAQVYVVGY